MLRTSQRSHVPSVENAMSRALAARRAAGDEVLDLTCSNPTELGLALSTAQLTQAFATADPARYAPAPFGDMHARRALATWLSARGVPANAPDIMLSASTSEAYTFLLKLLCDPGDELLVPQPSYPLLDVLARLEGVQLVPYPLRYAGEWHIDTSALARLRSDRTRAVITVHPNNPTGSFVKCAELAALLALELPIISDEVFCGYQARPAELASLALLAERALVFRLGGLSKTLLAPQLKLAWTSLTGPSQQVGHVRARLEHIADAFLSPNSWVQGALPALLSLAPVQLARAQQRIAGNREVLREALRGSAASLLPAEGGAMAIVRLPALMDEEALCVALLTRHGVLTQPGFFYDLQTGLTVVLSLLVMPEMFSRGVHKLRGFIDALAGDPRP